MCAYMLSSLSGYGFVYCMEISFLEKKWWDETVYCTKRIFYCVRKLLLKSSEAQALWQVFIRVYRTGFTVRHVGISTQLCELFSLKNSLWFISTLPPTHLSCVKVESVCDWEGVGVLSHSGDHIQFKTLYLTRFRIYQIARTKTEEGKGLQTDKDLLQSPFPGQYF